MKTRTFVNYCLVALIILVGLGLGLGLSKMVNAAKRPVEMAGQVAPQQGRKVDADTRPLKERAKQVGRYISDQPPNRVGAFVGLSDLARNSSAVIIGIPQENVSALSPDGRSITIDYKVRVMYVYKGAAREGDIVTVSLPGGRVGFDDGSTAEIRTSWFKKMMDGKAYALFLTATPRPGIFVTTGEAQGLFEVPKRAEDGMIVQAHTGLLNDPVAKYHNGDAREFFKELRRVTGKRLNR